MSEADKAAADNRIALEQRAIQQARLGKAETFSYLVKQHQPKVARLLWRFTRCRSTLEELVQDTFVEAFRSLKNYRGDGPWEAWLARIAVRTGYRHWQKQKRQTRERETWMERYRVMSQDGDRLDTDTVAELLHELLAQLPPRDRVVLTLQYIEGKSVAAMAALLDWSETMVKVQSFRARKKMHALLDQCGITGLGAAQGWDDLRMKRVASAETTAEAGRTST